MAFRDRYRGRKSETRQVLPVTTVVCDDTKTAVAYFRLLKQLVKDRRTVHVYPAPHCGADASAVIVFARKKAPDLREDGDRIFVLLDTDTNPNQDSIRRVADSNGVQVAFSSPCYEVWTLSHLEDTGEFFQHCDAVLGRVKSRWRELVGREFGAKAQADYAKIVALRDEAVARGRRRNPKTSQSWTEVWQVVEAITT